MTPEELKAHQDFITGALARLAAAQEQDRTDRLEFERWARRIIDSHDESLKEERESSKEFRKHMQGLAQIQAKQADLQAKQADLQAKQADLQAKQADLLVHQSERMDHMNAVQEEFKQDFRRLVHLLNMILDRLPPASH